MSAELSRIWAELTRAINSRPLYHDNPDITLEDLWSVAGQLSSLITQSNKILEKVPPDYSELILRTIKGHVDEAQSFKKDITDKIRAFQPGERKI